MYRIHRPVLASLGYSQHWQQILARLLVLLGVWIVSVVLHYGHYRNRYMVLGPNSSRLLSASSIFTEQIQVRDDAKKGVVLYGLSEKPKLTVETKWNVSSSLIVVAYHRQELSLWLNKGSSIQLRWELLTSSPRDLVVVLFKGEQNFEVVQPNPTNFSDTLSLSNSTHGNEEAEYIIEEDNRYSISISNMNPRSIMMALTVNISSKMYETTEATSRCSTINGLCRLELLFPKTQFFLLTTSNNVNTDGFYIELSFVIRVISYLAILGLAVAIICLILKYIGACEWERTGEEITETETETDPLVPGKAIGFTYGTITEDPESGMSSSSSSEDLYDGKICTVCYDEQRNCFFVPCGHRATCYSCAQRIIHEESKVCPICRRFIHKVRRLFCP